MTAKRQTDWLPTRQALLSRLKNLNDQRSWQEFFAQLLKTTEAFPDKGIEWRSLG